MSQKKRKLFLELLAQTGLVYESARALGYNSTAYLKQLRRDDEDFAAEWDIALESAVNVLEQEGLRRAHEGVSEPVYYKGEVVGHVQKYSDTLLMFMLRALKPDTYREKVNAGANVNVKFGIAVMPMTAQSENDWEKGAVDMHDGQAAIILPDKPVENRLITAKRGD